jgi:putative aldouronate transport system substrate-binding protein
MKQIPRILAFMLISCLILMIAACMKKENSVGETTSETPKSSGNVVRDKETGLVPMADADKPITFRMFIRDPSTAPSKSNPVLKKITELTGVTIEFEFLVGDLAQKQGVMLASEDYPDAIFAEASPFVDAGAFIPLEDKLPNYPNLYAHYKPFADNMTAKDGHQYILELYSVTTNTAPIFTDSGPGFFIQKAVLADMGYPVPRTLDEYFRLIEAYKAKYPMIDGMKTVGFEILCDGWRDFCLMNPPQHLMGAGNEGNVYVDPVTHKASLYQTTETARNYYKKLNEEYHKGIIEAETFTQNYDQYVSKISNGVVLGFFDQGWDFMAAENVLRSEGKYERTYVAVPITNPGVRDSYLDAPNGNIPGFNGIGITKKCKDPDRLLAFYDWLLQEDVQNYLQWGIEGKDYIDLENGGKVLTTERREIINDEAKKRELTGHVLWNYSPKRQGLYDNGEPCSPSDSEDEYMAALSEYDQNFLKSYNIKYPAQLLSPPVVRPDYYPVWSMVFEEGSSARVASNKLVETCRKYYPRLILSAPNEFDGLWQEFLDEIEHNDVQPYLDEVNRQIEQRMNR